MALQGIKSLKDVHNYLTQDIIDFLKGEDFKESKKTDLPFASNKSPIRFQKILGSTLESSYQCTITTSEVIVEIIHLDNNEGAEVFNNKFDSDESFVGSYNELINYISGVLM